MNIPTQRLSNHYLGKNRFGDPSDVVAWFGAVQAQDYLGSLWAIGLRIIDATEGAVEKAIADRRIVRTWPMRGTLHFVPAADVRWMLDLLTPRVIARSAGRYRHLELDERTFARSKKVFVRALEGGKQMTRREMYKALEAAKISVAGQRGIHILGHLAQEGLLCFGDRRAKQQTFALLEEWVPPARSLNREEALAKLARCYFRSHGPATLHDFAWWSGLKMTEARAGLEMVQADFSNAVIDGQAYWSPSSTPEAKSKSRAPVAILLPVYDEYTVAYKDRSAVLDPSHSSQSGNGIFSSPIALNGLIAGTWSRELKKDAVIISASPFARFEQAERSALERAAKRFGEFVGAPAILRYT
jgi:Winged helix DNA-binding domain